MNFMSDNGAVEYFWMSAAPVHETTQWLRAGSENGGLKCVKCSSPFKSNYKITNTYLGIPPLCFRFVPVTDREGHSPTLRTGGVSLKFSGIGGRMHALEQRSVERRLTFNHPQHCRISWRRSADWTNESVTCPKRGQDIRRKWGQNADSAREEM